MTLASGPQNGRGTTRFPVGTRGIADRMADFIDHLRLNGISVGPNDLQECLSAIRVIDPLNPEEVRRALRVLVATDHDRWRVFDELFNAFWFNAGNRNREAVRKKHVRSHSPRHALWKNRTGDSDTRQDDGTESGTNLSDDKGEEEHDGRDGRLRATRTELLSKRDLRNLMDEDGLRAAEKTAEALGRQLRQRRTRRYRMARRGARVDFRATMRASLARGGEPIEVRRMRRRDRPYRIVALLDVSGSMSQYAQVFLAFLKGLIDVDMTADAYLFHTKLVRVTGALRDRDALRAAGRLSLLAEGFGGGTDIATSLEQFNASYAARAVNGRSVVLILSDGYCTSEPAALATNLRRLSRRAGRIVWLNPLAGRPEITAVARGMKAALPHLDALCPADSIEALGRLEGEFAKL